MEARLCSSVWGCIRTETFMATMTYGGIKDLKWCECMYPRHTMTHPTLNQTGVHCVPPSGARGGRGDSLAGQVGHGGQHGAPVLLNINV